MRPTLLLLLFAASLAAQIAVPNDPRLPNQWPLQNIKASGAWARTNGSATITIAVIGTGANAAHEDLASKMIPGWNVLDNNSNTSDTAQSSSYVAGTAGAATNNAKGVAGVCWHCKIMPVKISNSGDVATEAKAAEGIRWAADHGAKVAVLVYPLSENAAVTQAAQYAISKGAVVVVGAGYSGTVINAPDNPSILTVGASAPLNDLFVWSGMGNNIDLVAPGSSLSTTGGSGYATTFGTHVSAGFVAGTIGLMLSLNPTLTPAQTMGMIQQSAIDLGVVGKDPKFGSGLLDAAKAVMLAEGNTSPPPPPPPPTDTTPPTISITEPTSGSSAWGIQLVKASVSDNVGIVKVEWSIDGVLKFTQGNVPPYMNTFDLTNLTGCTHTLTAKAYDAAGNNASTSKTIRCQFSVE